MSLSKKHLFVIAVVLLCGEAHADAGVFQPKIDPDEILTGRTETITVTAEIGGHPPLPSVNVSAYETDKDGNVIKMLGSMYDDGSHGDNRAGDTIHAMQFTLNEKMSTKKYVTVTAEYPDIQKVVSSAPMLLTVFDPLPAGTTEELVATLQKLRTAFKTYVKSMSLEAARQRTYEDAKNDPNITEVYRNDMSLSILFKGKIQGIVEMDDPDGPPHN